MRLYCAVYKRRRAMTFSTRIAMHNSVRRYFQNLFIIFTATTAVLLPATIAVQAAENDEFHEVETKYIFGNFTVGSSTGIEGDKAFEPETQANFGKGGGGHYGVSQTALEFEFTPTQYMQIIFGPTVSYYNIHGVPGLDDRNMAAINGFEAEFRSVLIDRNPSPIAVTLSLEPEFHSRDETTGEKVVNYGLEARRMPNSSRTACSGASIYFTSPRPRAPIWVNGRTNRHSASLRRLPFRSCQMSWSAPTSGICGITTALPSIHLPVTPSISVRLSIGKLLPRCS